MKFGKELGVRHSTGHAILDQAAEEGTLIGRAPRRQPRPHVGAASLPDAGQNLLHETVLGCLQHGEAEVAVPPGHRLQRFPCAAAAAVAGWRPAPANAVLSG